jgi:uncharacterized protein YoxC
MDSMIELMNQEAAATNITDGLASSLAMLALQGANMGEYFDKTSMTLEVVSAEISKLEKSITPLTIKQKELLKALHDWRNQLEVTKVTEGMSYQFSELNEMVKRLGDSIDTVDEKLKIYRAALSSLFSIDKSKFNTKNWEEWTSAVKDVSSFIDLLQGKKDIIDAFANTLGNAFADLSFAVGELAAGGKYAWMAFVDVIINTAQQIIAALLAAAAAALIAGKAITMPIGGLIAGAIAVGALMALWQGYKGKIQDTAKMAEGGVVPAGYPNDSYPARLTSGEMVIPPMKLPEFERAQAVDVTVKVEGVAKGQDLYYVVKEVERRYKNAH